MNDEEDYDDMRARLEEANEVILVNFLNHTIGVRKKGKMKMHKMADLLRFFGNEYLLNYESQNLLEGLSSFSSFVGDWFIRKCMWSDESSLRDNLAAYDAFIKYLTETDQLPQDQGEEYLIEKDERQLYVLRVKYYSNPEFELEDILDDFGMWDDAAILALENGITTSPLAPGQGRLTLNLLISSKSAKFLKLKAPELISFKNWTKSWDDPAHHWTSKWRCEECFSMKGTKERIFLVTNAASRYSFLIRLAPGDIKSLFMALNQKLMATLKNKGATHPATIQLQIATLSGSDRSLISFQNNHRLHLDCILEHSEFKNLEEVEERLNDVPSTTLATHSPDLEFAHLCDTDPPFPLDSGEAKIIPFLN